jgi:hypothetical protein
MDQRKEGTKGRKEPREGRKERRNRRNEGIEGRKESKEGRKESPVFIIVRISDPLWDPYVILCIV